MVEPQERGQAAAKQPGERMEEPILEARGLTVRYGETTAVRKVTLGVTERKVTAIIGPSGCGKSTLIRSFNRMNDFIPGAHIAGTVLYHGVDLYRKEIDPAEVRRRIGMVFQKPNPFPKSIFANIAWGPSINGFHGNLGELVEGALQKAALLGEVKDRLSSSAMELSGGQQQRLCIARALAMSPEVILMDEPCSALDPAATSKIEDLLFELKKRYTIVIVTHNMQQAARVADFTAFLDDGSLIEVGQTKQIFTRPADEKTEAYVTGRFG